MPQKDVFPVLLQYRNTYSIPVRLLSIRPLIITVTITKGLDPERTYQISSPRIPQNNEHRRRKEKASSTCGHQTCSSDTGNVAHCYTLVDFRPCFVEQHRLHHIVGLLLCLCRSIRVRNFHSRLAVSIFRGSQHIRIGAGAKAISTNSTVHLEMP